MKLYTKSTIKYCKERVFGKLFFYKKYLLKYYYSDQDSNLVETKDLYKNNLQIRIVGINRYKKNQQYISVNEYQLFEECKNIGKKLFDILWSDVAPIITNYGAYSLINTNILNNKIILDNINSIYNTISPFIKKYGFPVDYSSFTTSDIAETNSIDLNILCSYFLILHIISDLAGHYNKGYKIQKMYTILGISSEIEGNELILKLLNYKFLDHLHLENWQFKFVNIYPINSTDNLFSFAYERLKMNIIQKLSNYQIITRANMEGVPITISNNKSKNARTIEKKVPTSPIELKAYNANKQKIAHEKLVKEFRSIKYYARYIEKHDNSKEYTQLIQKVKDIRCVSHYKRKLYPYLKDDIFDAYNTLKN